MYFFSLATALATLAVIPPALASVGVHCGTTEDATLSDCRSLVDPATWYKSWAGSDNICHYGGLGVANNVACLGGGNCCVYVAGISPSDLGKETARAQAEGLLGCGDTGRNLINGMQKFSGGHGVCVSNGHGCGDCFDDGDFLT